MEPEKPSARLTIHLSASAMWHHRPAYTEIVHRAHAQGLSGASVLHGIEGYGAHMTVHHDKPSRLRGHGPCAIIVVETEDRLRAFLDTLEDILSVNGVAVLDTVLIHRPAHEIALP
ncbi:DUF190 domain-containing protein [Streptomyces cellulosae]